MTAIDDKFSLFWKAYPKCPHSRKSRKDALRKWDGLIKEGVSPDDLVKAAELFATERKGADSDYTMGPASFLGPLDDHWRDMLEGAQEKKEKERKRCLWAECQLNEDGLCSHPKPQCSMFDAAGRVMVRGCNSFKARLEIVDKANHRTQG